MCRESTGPVAGSGGVCSVLIFRPKGGLVHVSGTVSEMAAQNLFPGGGPGPHHRRQVRESVRARLRILVRQTLRRYKYPPDKTPGAVELILKQAEVISNHWTM